MSAWNDEVELIARRLAGLDDGEDWPTNEELGGGLTGTRDDEFRAAMMAEAAELIEALDAFRAAQRNGGAS